MGGQFGKREGANGKEDVCVVGDGKSSARTELSLAQNAAVANEGLRAEASRPWIAPPDDHVLGARVQRGVADKVAQR